MKRSLLVAAFALIGASAFAFDVREHYTKREVMIPMRDGVELFTIIYEPKDRSHTYPFLLLRTPYSIPPYGPDEYREQLGPSPEFDEDVIRVEREHQNDSRSASSPSRGGAGG